MKAADSQDPPRENAWSEMEGAGTFPNSRALPYLRTKLLKEGEQSLLRGRRVLRAQFNFRPAFWQLIGHVAALKSDLRQEVLASVPLENQHGALGGLIRRFNVGRRGERALACVKIA